MGNEVDRNQVLAKLCEQSFYDFVKYFWDTIISAEPQFNWHIKYLCDELQLLFDSVVAGKPKPYDLIINISPGTTKSTICSIMLPAWGWTRKPDAEFICASFTDDLAVHLARSCRKLVRSEKYQDLWPHLKILDDRDATSSFGFATGGGRKATSVGSNITGFHADMLIVDDPLNPQAASSTSAADIRKANEWMRETLPTRVRNKATTPTVLIMQRLHQNDPTGEWLSRIEGDELASPVKHICLPAEIIPGAAAVNPPELAEFYIDGLMDVTRLSKAVLRDQESRLGTFGYTGQFLQSPVPRTGGMFRPEDIKIETEVPIHTLKKIVRYWDKAATLNDGCYTVGVLMARDRDGFFWILDVIRGQWDASRRERIIKQTAAADKSRWKRVHIRIEEEAGGAGKESAESTIRNLAGYMVTRDRVTGDKLLRADPFSSQVNGGNVKMLAASWNADYIEELRHAGPNALYMDQIDASSGAFAYLNKAKKGGPLW